MEAIITELCSRQGAEARAWHTVDTASLHEQYQDVGPMAQRRRMRYAESLRDRAAHRESRGWMGVPAPYHYRDQAVERARSECGAADAELEQLDADVAAYDARAFTHHLSAVWVGNYDAVIREGHLPSESSDAQRNAAVREMVLRRCAVLGIAWEHRPYVPGPAPVRTLESDLVAFFVVARMTPVQRARCLEPREGTPRTAEWSSALVDMAARCGVQPSGSLFVSFESVLTGWGV